MDDAEMIKVYVDGQACSPLENSGAIATATISPTDYLVKVEMEGVAVNARGRDRAKLGRLIDALMDYATIERGIDENKCFLCGEKFITQSGLLDHRKAGHIAPGTLMVTDDDGNIKPAEKAEENTIEVGISGHYKCGFCHFEGGGEAVLAHQMKEHPEYNSPANDPFV